MTSAKLNPHLITAPAQTPVSITLLVGGTSIVTLIYAPYVQEGTQSFGVQNLSDEEHHTQSLAIKNTLLAIARTTPLGYHVGIIRLRLDK